MATPRGPGRPPQTSREEIRDAARALFLAHGYAGTSLGQVAEAVGISRTTLFAYVRAKRELVWEEPGIELLRDAFVAHPGPLVDAMAAAIVAGVPYPATEHRAVSERWQVIMADEELRAFAALRTETLTRAVVDGVRRRAPHADPERVDHVARALLAVSRQCTQQWATLPEPDVGLGEYTATRLAPFVTALRPLLP